MRQWYESTQGELFGHAGAPVRFEGLVQRNWRSCVGQDLDLTHLQVHSVPGFAQKPSTGVTSEAAQDVCDTPRRDRDGDYPCW